MRGYFEDMYFDDDATSPCFLSILALTLAGTTDATSSAASAAAFLPRRHGSDMAGANAHGREKEEPNSVTVYCWSQYIHKKNRM